MGYARSDSRPRLRCRTSRGRTRLAIIMLAVYGVTIAFGLSDKSGTFSSDHSRDRRHSSDTEPSDGAGGASSKRTDYVGRSNSRQHALSSLLLAPRFERSAP